MNQDKLSCWFLALTVGVTACDGPAPMPDAGARDSGVDAAVAYCTAARECTDDLFCNGIESCAPQAPGTDARGCLAGTPPCSAEMVCNEATDHCDVPCAEEDADGDNELSHACGGTDCDDHDGTRFSLHGETCDAVDNDCRPETLAGDDGDVDHDGAISAACCNTQDDGTTLCGTDCDDTRTGEFRDTVESCGVCGRSCFLACGADLECDEIVSIAAGGHHTCAVQRLGSVVCWGSNTDGQLGNGTTATSNYPVQVIGIDNATAVTAGDAHTCALLEDGTVACWGRNTSGELGSPTGTGSVTPIPVRRMLGTLTNVVQVSAGAHHTCAIDTDGQVWCWGANEQAQLGQANTDGTPSTYTGYYPALAEVGDATAVAAGPAHTCAMMRDGTAKCWGGNGSGQLGDGVASHGHRCNGVDDCSLPVTVDVDALIAIEETCGITSSSQLFCWGSWGASAGMSPVAQDTGLTNVAVFQSSRGGVCVRQADGAARCRSGNLYGQLGVGDAAGHTGYVAPMITGPIEAMAIGDGHICALTAAGQVFCAGGNQQGELGDHVAAHDTCSFGYDCALSPAPLASL